MINYLKIIRPANAGLAGIAVILGFWLSNSAMSLTSLLMMVVAAVCATGFGNVINDIKDLPSDRISHPDRPLPMGTITVHAASWYAGVLGLLSVTAAFTVSRIHGVATIIPISLLVLYTLVLKSTPLAGNLIVSLLVAYALLFGGIKAPEFHRLLIPSVLALLINFCREIIKDIQDQPGDRAAGYVTSARLPPKVLNAILVITSVTYLSALALPGVLSDFGVTYLIVCGLTVVPLHVVWMSLKFTQGWHRRLRLISLLVKIEMVCGLCALAIDQLWQGL